MARIVFINSVCYGSTGNICKNLYKMAEKEGHECCIAYGRGLEPEGFFSKRIGSNIDVYAHAILSRVNDMSGFGSIKATKEFVKWLEEYKPDIIHMHNLHGYYLNIEILFQYLKKNPKVKKIWTLHDCWSYTGHCAHYLNAKCFQWKEECKRCEHRNSYPKAFVSNAEKNFKRKRKAFLGVENLTIISVSEWLEQQVTNSFLKEYKTDIITSGINTEIFKYRECDFKASRGLADKSIILGVASVWDEKKGLDDFLKLAKKIPPNYVIVLVGLNGNQINSFPQNIVGIERTENQVQLAEIYSAADIFFNPTKEETFGLTNVEAQACGTTVVSYIVGGTVETLVNENAYGVSSLEEFLGMLDDINCDKTKVNVASQLFDKDIRMTRYLKYYCERE